MSSLLTNLGVARCYEFFTIPDDAGYIPNEFGADKDLFIGPKVIRTITITNGETLQARDIVVFGKLIIQSTNLNPALRGTLKARDIFVGGALTIQNAANLKGKNLLQAPKLRQELQDLLVDWFDFQRETTKKMGLKSILT